jgi:hypothetical protein
MRIDCLTFLGACFLLIVEFQSFPRSFSVCVHNKIHSIHRLSDDKIADLSSDYKRYFSILYSSPRNGPQMYKAPLDTVINRCRKQGDYTELCDYADNIINGQEKIAPAFLTKMITYLGEANQLGRAMFITQRAKSRGTIPNEKHYCALMNAARKAGQWEISLE